MSAEDINSLNGNFKEVYGEVIEDLVPQTDILFRNDRVKFVRKDGREGLAYNQPVLLALASSASWGIGSANLNPVIPSQMGNASLTATQIVTRDQVTYNAAVRAMGSKAAFEDSVGLVIKNLYKSHGKFAELDLLYGAGSGTPTGTSLGQSTVIVAATANAKATISYATWAPAIWSGFQNASLDAYQGTSKINTNAALVVVAVGASPVSNSVGGTITVSGNAADISALIAASGGTAVDFYFLGAYGANMVGLEAILKNTGSLFGIDSSVYDLWQANQYSAGSAQLTFSKLQQAISLAVSRGLDEEVMTLVNPATFADLVSEQAGARRYDSSYKPKKGENGMEAIQFYGPSGANEVLPHMFVHQGEAFVVPADRLMKTGAAEGIVDSLAGMGQLFLQVPDSSAAEVRLLSDFGLLLDAPAKAVLITSITNSISA